MGMPIGLKPEWIHDIQRAQEVIDACSRYIHHDPPMSIPAAWIKELGALCEKIEARKAAP